MIAYIIWDIRPEIFEGFDFLRWYGLCWVAGFLVAHKILLHIYQSEDIASSALDTLTIYMVVGVILGARFGHILFYDPVYYWNNPIEILPFKIDPFEFTGLLGLASHGGVLGALIALWLYNRKYKMGYLFLLDKIVIGGAALGAFIRLGNLMNSEIIGIPSSVSWAFVFTRIDQIPRHPAQLYESIFYLIVTVILFFIWKSGEFRQRSGFVSGVGITLIFTQRFLIEFLKEDQVAFEGSLQFNMGQLLSIPMILAAIFLAVNSFPRTKNPESN